MFEDRGVSSVVGLILLIALTTVIVAAIGLTAYKFTNRMPTKSPVGAVMDFEETPQGMLVRPTIVKSPVIVELNGDSITKITGVDVGREIFLPTSPGDRLTVTASTGTGRILVNKKIHEKEAGDFVAYYTFEKGEGDTLIDRSGNNNDGDIVEGGNEDNFPKWVTDDVGTALTFDENDGYVVVDDLRVENVSDIEGFTIAVKYIIEGDTGEIQQLIEHTDTDTGLEWFIEMADKSYSPYEIEFSAPFPNKHLYTENSNSAGEVHITIGTYDGETATLYHDGKFVGSKEEEEDVGLGDVKIGRDFEANIQYLNGRIYQIRLYYTVLNEEEAKIVTKAMRSEAE